MGQVSQNEDIAKRTEGEEVLGDRFPSSAPRVPVYASASRVRASIAPRERDIRIEWRRVGFRRFTVKVDIDA